MSGLALRHMPVDAWVQWYDSVCHLGVPHIQNMQEVFVKPLRNTAFQVKVANRSPVCIPRCKELNCEHAAVATLVGVSGLVLELRSVPACLCRMRTRRGWAPSRRTSRSWRRRRAPTSCHQRSSRYGASRQPNCGKLILNVPILYAGVQRCKLRFPKSCLPSRHF